VPDFYPTLAKQLRSGVALGSRSLMITAALEAGWLAATNNSHQNCQMIHYIFGLFMAGELFVVRGS
jgi:hypothetical protein